MAANLLKSPSPYLIEKVNDIFYKFFHKTSRFILYADCNHVVRGVVRECLKRNATDATPKYALARELSKFYYELSDEKQVSISDSQLRYAVYKAARDKKLSTTALSSIREAHSKDKLLEVSCTKKSLWKVTELSDDEAAEFASLDWGNEKEGKTPSASI